ncbi:hypothetical protein AN958_01097 [Leucoagaricus sp. SymC.cos]|nr:hypothetical protein AN958_01097 [Leucoagaricus sp. SymC.cos]
MKFNFATTVVVAAITFALGGNAAISCQDEGNARGSICVFGDCPDGWRSVFYDYGCPDGAKCCI